MEEEKRKGGREEVRWRGDGGCEIEIEGNEMERQREDGS